MTDLINLVWWWWWRLCREDIAAAATILSATFLFLSPTTTSRQEQRAHEGGGPRACPKAKPLSQEGHGQGGPDQGVRAVHDLRAGGPHRRRRRHLNVSCEEVHYAAIPNHCGQDSGHFLWGHGSKESGILGPLPRVRGPERRGRPRAEQRLRDHLPRHQVRRTQPLGGGEGVEADVEGGVEHRGQHAQRVAHQQGPGVAPRSGHRVQGDHAHARHRQQAGRPHAPWHHHAQQALQQRHNQGCHLSAEACLGSSGKAQAQYVGCCSHELPESKFQPCKLRCLVCKKATPFSALGLCC
mmetsp:Transcript_13616/g.21571  ORF Transcript_13616/g.21571 Transcript_13616/m.21571 type:complete len:296 (-) Transcript_13616:649-1536(-)